MIQIDAPHFCAGAELYDGKVVRAAPIIKYMKGWDIHRIKMYCKKKKWKLEIINEISSDNEFLEF